MRKWILAALSALAFALPSIDSSRADETFGESDEATSPPLWQIVDRAVIVARVRLTDRSAMDVFGRVKKGSPIRSEWLCGYTYRAKVIESLKGPADDFEFFSAVESDFKGFDRDYLVFVFHHDRENTQRAFDAVSPLLRVSDANKLRCKLAADYYVPVQPQLLRAFDPEAARTFGSEWLTAPTRNSTLFCSGEPPIRRFVTRKKRPEDRADNLVQWTSAKSYIIQARKSWYLFWQNRLDTC